MNFSHPTPRFVGALCVAFALLFIAPATRAATARVNLTVSWDDAAQQGPTTGIRLEPITPPWSEGGPVVIGDPIVRASKTSPVVITNVFGSDNTNTANYRITISSRVPTVFYVKVWLTNAVAGDLIIAAPGQSQAWAAGHFIQIIRGSGTSNSFTVPRLFETAGGTNMPGSSNFVWTLTNELTGAGEWRTNAGGGGTSDAITNAHTVSVSLKTNLLVSGTNGANHLRVTNLSILSSNAIFRTQDDVGGALDVLFMAYPGFTTPGASFGSGNSVTPDENSFWIGHANNVSGTDNFALAGSSEITNTHAAIGYGLKSIGASFIGGTGARVFGNDSYALGHDVTASATSAGVIGSTITNTTANSLDLGHSQDSRVSIGLGGSTFRTNVTMSYLTASKFARTDGSKVVASSAYDDADIANLQGGTNGLLSRITSIEGSTNSFAKLTAATYLTNWANAVSNYVDTASSNRVRVAAGTGGITVTPSGSAGVMTFTVNDDDAGAGGTNFAGLIVTNTIQRGWKWMGFDTNLVLSWAGTNHYIAQPSNTLTIAFANTPAAGSFAQEMRLELYNTNASSVTVVFPSSVDWGSNASPVYLSGTNHYVFRFNGTNIYGFSGQVLTTGSGETNVLNVSPTLIASVLRGANMPLLTASRALALNSSGDITNVTSSSPSSEYVKADGTTGNPSGTTGSWWVSTNGVFVGPIVSGVGAFSISTGGAVVGDIAVVQ